jgi:hypothetical protein
MSNYLEKIYLTQRRQAAKKDAKMDIIIIFPNSCAFAPLREIN